MCGVAWGCKKNDKIMICRKKRTVDTKMITQHKTAIVNGDKIMPPKPQVGSTRMREDNNYADWPGLRCRTNNV
jgi:hypothetical protein